MVSPKYVGDVLAYFFWVEPHHPPHPFITTTQIGQAEGL